MGPFSWPSPWRRNGLQMGGREAEEGLGGSGARESLMRPVAQVVRQGEFEPSFQVRRGQGSLETKAAGVLDRPQNRSRRAVA